MNNSTIGSITQAMNDAQDPQERERAFEVLYDFVDKTVRPLAIRRLERSGPAVFDANDLVQTVMFSLIERDDLADFENRRQLAGLLRTVAERQIISRRRHETAQRRSPSEGMKLGAIDEYHQAKRLPQPLKGLARQRRNSPAVESFSSSGSSWPQTLEAYLQPGNDEDVEAMLDFTDYIYSNLPHSLQRLLRMLVQRYTNAEIAHSLGDIDQASVRRQIERLQRHIKELIKKSEIASGD